MCHVHVFHDCQNCYYKKHCETEHEITSSMQLDDIYFVDYDLACKVYHKKSFNFENGYFVGSLQHKVVFVHKIIETIMQSDLNDVIKVSFLKRVLQLQF